MLITVTVDVRDLDPGGPPPERAAVTFARLTPTDADGILLTTAAVQVPLTGGHGVVQLTAGTPYLVRCYGIRGYSTPFAVLTGSGPTTLAQLWRTGQIDPRDFQIVPVPQALQDLLDAQAAAAAATYATKDELAAAGDGGGPGGQMLTQSSPSASWIFSHALGRIPVVAVYDTTGEQIVPDVHASTTSLSLTFANPMAGTAVLT